MKTISLLTDFGLTDAYVGVMKGAILTHVDRPVQLVDLSHGVAPGDISGAAYLLASSWRYFPPGTIHVAVVDPGVGSKRRILIAEADGAVFIAPDNGLLTRVLGEAEKRRVYSIENRVFYLSPMSRTFHGRDVFAPLAAAMVRGIKLEDLGNVIEDWVTLPLQLAEHGEGGAVSGQVIYIDRYGNMVTNIAGNELPLSPVVHVKDKKLRGVSGSYGAVAEGEALAIVGSTHRLEISVRGGSAAAVFGMKVGDAVRAEPGLRMG
jgi:S-adenosylmethionine hydrolase